MSNPQIFTGIKVADLRSNLGNETPALRRLTDWIKNHIGTRRADLPQARPSDAVAPAARLYITELAKMVVGRPEGELIFIHAEYTEGSVRFGIGPNGGSKAEEYVSEEVEASVTAVISAMKNSAARSDLISVNDLRAFLKKKGNERVRVLTFSGPNNSKTINALMDVYGGVAPPVSDLADAVITAPGGQLQFAVSGFGSSVTVMAVSEAMNARINIGVGEFIVIEVSGAVAMKLEVESHPIPMSNQSLAIIA